MFSSILSIWRTRVSGVLSARVSGGIQVKHLLFILAAALAFGRPASAVTPFAPDEHVCIVGNSLGDRMQHDGWLETLLQARNPGKRLVIRNLAYSGDQVSARPRIQGSPTLEDYLALCKADVILCFFGYNESFAGPAGVAKFKADYTRWIEAVRGQTYNGKSPPRFILFSPIAWEDTGDPLLPDPHDGNERLAAYTAAVAEVAAAVKADYVDLFAPTQALYDASEPPLTINGVHLSEEGNRRLAEVIAEVLTGGKVAADASLEPLRQAVLDKNLHWHNRYRATNGNDIWGSRSTLSFVNGQSNADVLKPEMVQRDVQTANRDLRIWAVATGADLKVDDANMPPPVEVISNVGGGSKSSSAKKEGTGDYTGGQEAIALMTPAKGFEVGLFADEKRFPELVNPVQMSVDPKGRLWVAAWKTYPMWRPGDVMDDRLLILPDDNRDGVADRCVTFARVHNPTGFEFWNGGVLVASAPDVLFLKDTDGDDVADVCVRLLQGIEAADTHHAANGFAYGPDGGMYWQRGVFIVENVETPWGPARPSSATGMYRFDPRRHTFGFHAANGPNPHGTAFDRWGYHFATDGTSGSPFQVTPSPKGFRMRSLFQKTVRPVPASGIVSSAQFPAENQQNFLICNVIGFLGIKQYRIDRDATTGEANGVEVEDLVVSSDRNFRPTDVEFGEDGSLYFSDWHNRIIGHMQHNARDPSRDHQHGRIYRMIATGRPLQEPVAIAGQPLDVLMRNLEHPVDGVRYRTRIELSARDPAAVLAACQEWMKRFDPAKPEHAHALLEALWLHQRLHVRNTGLLDQMLASPEPHARVAAATVRHHWERGGAAGEEEAPVAPTVAKQGPTRKLTPAEKAVYELGREVYHREAHCVTCHQADGKGLPNLYPPIARSNWLDGDDERSVKIALKGLWGAIEVNGKKYDPAAGGIPPMIGFADLLKDHEIAAVLTYVNLSFGNKGAVVTPEMVTRLRAATRDQTTFYNPDELLKAHPLRKP
jgi:mono/diheme cytochrome c family protein/lysophospholipase L1-like esterase